MKPWTVSRGPIEANESDIRKAAAISALLVRPVGILPVALGDPIKPFTVGLFNDFRPLLKPDCALMALRRAVGVYVNSKMYCFAAAQPDAIRHDLDGNPVEPVSPEARLFAQEKFLGFRKDRNGAPAPATPQHHRSEPMTKAEQIRATLLGPKARKSAASG